MNLTKSLTRIINKLVGKLKSEKELKEVLKRKFTKKEYKVFIAIEEEKEISYIKDLLGEDEERINKLYKNCCRKLNQELFKKELTIID